MPWASCYVLLEKKVLLDEGGFREFPFMLPKWMRVAGEKYGRGPGVNMLPDIKMLNEMRKTVIKAAQKVVDPPLQLPDDGFMGPIRMTPSALNYYRSGSQDRIEAIKTEGRIDLGVEVLQSVQQSILRGFYTDWLQMPEEKHEGSRVAATWVIERRQEKMRLIAPMLSRQQSEFLGPLIERVFAIMLRRGAFLPPPEEMSGQSIAIDYVSPVAKAQRAQEAEGVLSLYSLMAPVAEVDPTALRVVNLEELARWGADIYGVPSRILRTREQMEQERQQQMAIDNARETKQDVVDLAGAASDAGQADRNFADAQQIRRGSSASQ